ncbi:MAG: type I-U CRISPR-associated protein Cas7 [Mycobacterium sp.]
MSKLSYQQLFAACEPGGASALSVITELAPAGGSHAAITPAPYLVGSGTAAFAYEARFIDGESTAVVIIDQRQSQVNRVETAILRGIRDQHPVLGRVPRVQVSYDGGRIVYTDLELRQRVYDNHILAGAVDGKPAVSHPLYRTARDCSPENARSLLELSPGSLVFGSWDSTRPARQSRYRGALVGEIIGVLVDQRNGIPRRDRGGAQVPAGGDELAGPGDELSPDLIRSMEGAAVAAGAVSCSRIIRTQVLSFAALRQLRFDSGPVGDAACRVLLAAYALAGVARANAELSIRANCDLVEVAPTSVKLDARDGEFVDLAALSIEEADELLELALDEAHREADITWRGQVLKVTGNPAVQAAARSGGSASQGTVTHPQRRFRLPHFIESRRSALRD